MFFRYRSKLLKLYQRYELKANHNLQQRIDLQEAVVKTISKIRIESKSQHFQNGTHLHLVVKTISKIRIESKSQQAAPAITDTVGC